MAMPHKWKEFWTLTLLNFFSFLFFFSILWISYYISFMIQHFPFHLFTVIYGEITQGFCRIDLITHSLKHAFKFRQLCKVKQSIAYFYTRLKASINKAKQWTLLTPGTNAKRKKKHLCQRQKVLPPHFPLPTAHFPLYPQISKKGKDWGGVGILKERCQREEGRSKVAKYQRRGMKINVEGWSAEN